VEPVMAGA